MTLISTDILDQHLAPHDYYGRICLVRTDFTNNNNNNNNQKKKNNNIDTTIVDKYKLWPALQYTNIHELMHDIDQHIPDDTYTLLHVGGSNKKEIQGNDTCPIYETL